MKHRDWKKVALVTVSICVLGSITAAALGKPEYIESHSSHRENVTSYEEAVNMQRGFDAAVKMTKGFSNGYQFKEAVPSYLSAQDEKHNTLEKQTTMNVTYAKEGMKDVTLFNNRLTGTEETRADEIMTLEDGTELRYRRLANKFVPPDYVPTEEEVKLQEEGKLNIGYGSDQVEEKVSVNVSWKQDGISYSLFTFEESMSAAELFQMAREVAERK